MTRECNMSNSKEEIEKQIALNERAIKEAKATIEKLKSKSSLSEFFNKPLPPGFKFRWNDRRGDPNYDPYWEVWLEGCPHGWRNVYYEESCDNDREIAYAKANKAAWALSDIAHVVVAHANKENVDG
jgi:hypothetical protein